jgi:hypothetical protein
VDELNLNDFRIHGPLHLLTPSERVLLASALSEAITRILDNRSPPRSQRDTEEPP